MAKGTTKSKATPSRRERPLSPREKLFAHILVRPGMSGAAAATEAGYSDDPASAATIASRLLRKVKVAALVEKLRAKQLEKISTKAQDVLDELEHVAMARLSRVVTDDGKVRPIEEWSEDEKAALSKLEVVQDHLIAGGPRVTDDGVKVGPPVAFTTTKIEMAGKLKALEVLAKHHKLLIDTVDHKHSGTVYVVDPYGEAPPAAEGDEE